MKLTLNPYTMVIDVNGEYKFFLTDHNNAIKLMPNEEQLHLFEHMSQGDFCEYEHLCDILGTTIVDALIQTGCIVPGSIDTQSLFSRTNAFFLTHNMPEARARLSSKRVLVLGCGGIGTHMAWHMATLGVNKITLVDFDTVEISNLNRQLLFDSNDVGSIKTDILKSKLMAINPNLIIETLCKKIGSEEELEEICLSDNYDLIIKALDSPAEFPVWLDSVAKKHSLTYVAGITMRENVLIGPSYIPETSSYGWSDLVGISTNIGHKVYGTAPSLGVMLYHISDELAIEAFKILSGYGEPKYIDKILCRNVITDEESLIEKGNSRKEVSDKTSKTTAVTLAINFVLMIVMATMNTQVGWFIPISLGISMILPFVLFKSNQDVVRCTFVNSTIIAIGVLVRYIYSMDVSTPTALVSSIVLMFGIHSATILFACITNYFMHKLFYKHRGRQK